MPFLGSKIIELTFWPHSDLFINWPNFIEESISTENDTGNISIKYSEVPVFTYILASKLWADFLSEKILEEAKNKNFVSFSNEEYNELCRNINSKTKFRQKLWEQLEDKVVKSTCLMNS